MKTAEKTITPPNADAQEAENRVEDKLRQLRSLLMSMYGVGAEGFEDIGPEHRDNLVWLASDLVHEIYRVREDAQADELRARGIPIPRRTEVNHG